MSNHKVNSKKKSFQTIKKIWKYADPWKFRFYAGFLIGCTMNLYQAFAGSFLTSKITSVCMDGEMKGLYQFIIQSILLMAFGAIVYPICFGNVYTTYARVSGSIREKLFTHMEKLPVSYMESKHSGDVISRATTDFYDAIQLVAYPTVGQGNPFALIFTVVAICVITICSNWILGLISIVISFFNVIIISKLTKMLKKKEWDVKQSSANASKEIVNALSGTMVSRIFGMEKLLSKKYQKWTDQMYNSNIALIGKKALIYLTSELQCFLSFTGTTIIGLWLSHKNLIDIPTVIFISSLQFSLSDIISQLGQKFAQMQKYIVSAERLLEFLEVEEEEVRQDNASPMYKSENAIEISHLDFRYEKDSDPIFEDFSISVKNGEKLAVVGGSGGGKSSLFKLLLAFAKENDGDIKVFGNSVQEYSLATLRKQYSYVPQDCYLFDTSIRENILWGRPDATEEELQKAVDDAYLREFVSSLPDGLDTKVGERGAQLSGGQRQRIAIARAFLKNSPIILLDEATSALDSQSEQEVQKALNNLVTSRTAIIIAHRLSTIKKMDRIVVLEKGTIIEEGNHEMLMSLNGRYKELFNMQYV
ncbi:ABC transporter ATP-binding protein [Anaerosporobacter sp.]